MLLDNVYLEGTVSQLFYVGPGLYFPNIYKEAEKLSVHYATFLAPLPYSCSVRKTAE